jgi:hypothetical protein
VSVDTADLWTCPSCGKRFVTKNMWHSCGSHTVEQFMEGKGEIAWDYWRKLQEMVGKCGPYSIVANKTGLAFMVRVRFAGMQAVSDRGMSFAFWLKRRIEHPRFRKVEYLTHSDWVYRLRVASLEELDDQVQEWLCMAYQVGCQAAVKK